MVLRNKLREPTQTMQSQLMAEKNDLKSGAFRDANMAMCALVADGSVDPVERQRTAGLITSIEVLQNFLVDRLQQRFNLPFLIAAGLSLRGLSS